jgi:hypothetical protein
MANNDYPNWHSCLECKHFTGVILEEKPTLTTHGHKSKRNKYLYECKATKSGHIPHYVLSPNDLNIKHDHKCPYEKK